MREGDGEGEEAAVLTDAVRRVILVGDDSTTFASGTSATTLAPFFAVGTLVEFLVNTIL